MLGGFYIYMLWCIDLGWKIFVIILMVIWSCGNWYVYELVVKRVVDGG